MSSSRESLIAVLASKTGLEPSEVDKLLSTPPNPENGDFTLPCFVLAKTMRKAPKMIAEELAADFPMPEGIEKVVPVNGYLNFYADRQATGAAILKEIDLKGSQYGHSAPAGKTAVIDYSSPNIGKQLAFHHLRSTMIGNALDKCYRAAGWQVEAVNHLGDWGTAFGKLIVMYLRSGKTDSAEDLASLNLQALNDMYVSFGKIAQEEPELENQAREAFAKMEQGDALHLKLWAAFREVTLSELKDLYDLMGVSFDHYIGEAFFNDHLDKVIETLQAKELMVKSQERDVVMLDEEDMPPCLIRKSDGSSLYATRDIAAAMYRKNRWDFDRCLYVVDNGQGLHFKQVFKVMDKAGFDWHSQLEHIPFGLILHWNEAEQKWSKGSSKMGNSNTLREVFEAAQSKIVEFIDAKNPQLEDKEEVAMQIGISALVFNDLKNRRLIDVKFDWDAALSFEGDTGPYVQNAHVRLCSIMEKSARRVQVDEVDFSQLGEEQAVDLIRLLGQLNDKVESVVNSNEPYMLAQYCLRIAEASHRFIHHCRVLGSEEETSRLFLVQCAQQVMENSLKLIGLNPIRKM